MSLKKMENTMEATFLMIWHIFYDVAYIYWLSNILLIFTIKKIALYQNIIV